MNDETEGGAIPGDTVCIFTHEKSDDTHTVIWKVGIVVGALADGVLRCKVMEWGVAPYDLEVGPWPEEAPRDAKGNPIYGGTYWAESPDSLPDFDNAWRDREEETTEDRLQAEERERLAHEDAKATMDTRPEPPPHAPPHGFKLGA